MNERRRSATWRPVKPRRDSLGKTDDETILTGRRKEQVGKMSWFTVRIVGFNEFKFAQVFFFLFLHPFTVTKAKSSRSKISVK